MSSPSNQRYPQDKQPDNRPPAYPNQTYHPSSQLRHAAVIKRYSLPFLYRPAVQPRPISASAPASGGLRRAPQRERQWRWTVRYRLVSPRRPAGFIVRRSPMTPFQLPRSLRELLLPLLVLLGAASNSVLLRRRYVMPSLYVVRPLFVSTDSVSALPIRSP